MHKEDDVALPLDGLVGYEHVSDVELRMRATFVGALSGRKPNSGESTVQVLLNLESHRQVGKTRIAATQAGHLQSNQSSS